MYHAGLNAHSQERRREQHQQAAAREHSEADYIDHLVEAEALARIYRAIDELPEQCRRIFTLNRFEGMSNQAIADQLSLSKRTVETQISKALRLLRQALFSLFLFFF